MWRSNQNETWRLFPWNWIPSSSCPEPFQLWLFSCPAFEVPDKWSMVWLNIGEEGKKPERERTYPSLNNNFYTVRGVVIRVRSSGFLTEFCSNFSSTQVKQRQHCIHIFSGLQHLRPPCRRYSFQQNANENEK